jgi:hypothetical protein
MKGGWLREPRNGSALVFIHGLFSTNDSAWRSNTAYWPALVQGETALAGHGIYLFDYDTALTSGNYSLSDASTALNEFLSLDGITAMPQIVFIAHSMGGIVARHFVVARQLRFAQARTSVGFFLVASPSLGSEFANALSSLGLIYNVQIDALRFRQANVWLNDLDQQFMNLKERQPFPLFGRELVEADPYLLPRMVFASRQVVIPASGARYFGEAIKVPRSDHVSIVKPVDREALQHRMLVRFILDHPPPRAADAGVTAPPPGPGIFSPATDTGAKADSPPLDALARAAIAADAHGIKSLPPPDAAPEAVFEIASRLDTGHIMERVAAAWLVQRSGAAAAVFRHAIGLPGMTADRLRRYAPWLRFVAERDRDPLIWKLAETAIETLDPDEPDRTRLQAAILGFGGLAEYMPRQDWSDRETAGRYGHEYLRALIAAGAIASSRNAIRSAISRAVEVAAARAAINNDFHMVDYLPRFRLMPVSHGPAVLDVLVANRAPALMVQAFLIHSCLRPNAQTRPAIWALTEHERADVRAAARQALAFLPPRTAADAAGKRAALHERDAAFALAAGADGWTDALGDLDALLANGASLEERYAAAWALGRLARHDEPARKAALRQSTACDDEMARAVLLAGLAAIDPALAAAEIRRQLPAGLGIERFMFLVAEAHVSDAGGLLRHLAVTPEDELYVPMLLPPLQLAFLEAMARAAAASPLIAELSSLCDVT